MVLAMLAASFGIIGYSLPQDQIGYWAIKVVTSVYKVILVIESFLVEVPV